MLLDYPKIYFYFRTVGSDFHGSPLIFIHKTMKQKHSWKNNNHTFIPRAKFRNFLKVSRNLEGVALSQDKAYFIGRRLLAR